MSEVPDALRAALAPRYAVVREIGAGGMARVYLALEEHPRRHVAVKVLEPELCTRLFRERFVREVELCSRLNHPHIVPIFAAGGVDCYLYYVMPYIEGESLRHRLARERTLGLDDALHIAGDVADALSYAHGQGVIHRDIKPENILLSGGHAIVADFGIARAISAAGNATLTQAGQAIGSPGYMSPEQALGATSLDARTDVYSLACVLFESLAGVPPQRTPLDRHVGNWRLLDQSGALRATTGGGARAVKHALSRALALLPEERFAGATEFAEALGAHGHRPSLPTRGVFAGRRRWPAALLGAGLLGLGAGGAIHLANRPSAMVRERVAVAVFENRTGDTALASLGHMTADWITQGLAQTGLVDVVPTATAFAAARGDVRALARETGAGTVVSGAYYRQNDTIQFQVQVTDAREGHVLRALDPVRAPSARALDAVESVRQRVMAALATQFSPQLLNWAGRASQPPSYAAYQEFVQGLDDFLHFNHAEAVGHFERAAASDSTFRIPLVWSALSRMNVGDFAGADSLARRVRRSPGSLAPLDRRFLAWVEAEIRADRTGALEAARELAAIAPGSEALYVVAEAALHLNRPAEAARVFQELGPDRGFLRGWTEYWGNLTAALHLAGDHKRELRAAREGRRRHPQSPGAAAYELRALAALGRVDDARERLSEALALPAEPGWTPADVALLAARELRAHGHEAAAREALDRAVAWLGSRPAGSAETPAARYALMTVAYFDGRLNEAERLARSLETAARARPGLRSGSREHPFLSLHEPADSVALAGFFGAIAARRGDTAAAVRFDRVLERFDQRPYLMGRHLLWRARIHAQLGDADAAVALLRQAFARGYPFDVNLHSDPAFEPLRDDAGFQQLLHPKG